MKKIMSFILIITLVCSMFLVGCSSDNGQSGSSDEIVISAVTFVDSTKTEASIEVFKLFIDRFNEAAKGRCRIQIQGGPEVIPVRDQVSCVSKGITDMAMVYGTHTSLVPLVSVVGNSEATPAEERENGFFDMYDKAHNEKGVKVLQRTETDSGFYIYAKDRIDELSDFKNLKIRSHAGLDPFFNELGANPVHINVDEMYTALERGVVSAAPYSPYAFEFALQEVAKYVVDHQFWKAHSTYTYMNLDKFNSLPKDIQDLLVETALEVEKEMPEICEKMKNDERERMIDAGVEYVSLSPEEAEEFISLSISSKWADVEKQGLISKEVLEQVQGMIRKTK